MWALMNLVLEETTFLKNLAGSENEETWDRGEGIEGKVVAAQI